MALDSAMKYATQFGDDYVSVEHLYMALLAQKGTKSESVFKKFHLSMEGFLESLKKDEAELWKRVDGTCDLVIKTLEGTMSADHGDYIIKGVQNEIYPCKPDIFKQTYEKVM